MPSSTPKTVCQMTSPPRPKKATPRPSMPRRYPTGVASSAHFRPLPLVRLMRLATVFDVVAVAGSALFSAFGWRDTRDSSHAPAAAKQPYMTSRVPVAAAAVIARTSAAMTAPSIGVRGWSGDVRGGASWCSTFTSVPLGSGRGGGGRAGRRRDPPPPGRARGGGGGGVGGGGGGGRGGRACGSGAGGRAEGLGGRGLGAPGRARRARRHGRGNLRRHRVRRRLRDRDLLEAAAVRARGGVTLWRGTGGLPANRSPHDRVALHDDGGDVPDVLGARHVAAL